MKLWTTTVEKMNDPNYAKEVRVILINDEHITIEWPSFVDIGERARRTIRDLEGDLLPGRNRPE